VTVIAEVREYAQLLEVLRSYKPGHADLPLMLRPIEIKTLNPRTLGAILGSLCLKIEVHTDDEQLAKIRPRLTPRKNARALSQHSRTRRYSFFRGDSEKAREIHKIWMARSTPRQRSEIARNAAQARWRRNANGRGRRG